MATVLLLIDLVREEAEVRGVQQVHLLPDLHEHGLSSASTVGG